MRLALANPADAEPPGTRTDRVDRIPMASKLKAPPPVEVRTFLRLLHISPASLWVLGVTYEGETRNISEGGLQFYTEQPRTAEVDLQQWRIGRISFKLPHFPEPLQQDVRIAWIAGQTSLHIGCQFLVGLPMVALFILREMRRSQLLLGR